MFSCDPSTIDIAQLVPEQSRIYACCDDAVQSDQFCLGKFRVLVQAEGLSCQVYNVVLANLGKGVHHLGFQRVHLWTLGSASINAATQNIPHHTPAPGVLQQSSPSRHF